LWVKPCAQTVIGAEIVCDHRAADGHVLANEAFQGFHLGVGDRAGANLASFISDAGNCGSADCSTSSAELLAGVLVTLFSTDVGVVNLGVIAHVAVSILQPRLADALRQKPSGLLRDAEFASHLGGRDAFTGAREHVDGEQPFLLFLQNGKLGY